MHSFIVNLNTLTASLFLCVFFIILGSVSIKKNKKIIIQLILISTLLIMKVSYILKRMDMEILIGQEYELFYIFITIDIVILIIFYYLSQQDKMNLKDNVLNMIDDSIERMVNGYVAEDGIVNSESLIQDIETSFGIEDVATLKDENATAEDVINELKEKTHEIYENKENEFGSENMRELERVVMLKVVDQKWMDHIDDMDELKNGIGLRAYGQKDPVVQYRLEGADMFDDMIEALKDDVAKIMLNIQKKEENVKRTETAEITGAGLEDTAINLVDGTVKPKEGGLNKTVVNTEPKVGRNDPCPCGSGKKYKNCCGKNA